MKIIILPVIAAALSACASPPVITAGADPANPDIRVPQQGYSPVTAGTLDLRPVEPKPWVERNRDVAPGKGGH